jgi:predicted enzyme related to lactoylglutathione lyase
VTEVQSPTTGIISWIDLASTDLDRSKAFYTSLFGWDAFTVPDPDAGGYGFFLKDGKEAAGFGPAMGEPISAWNAYVSVEDADATADGVRAAGGQVLAGPMDVFNQGRLAVFSDPSGAVFSIWQSKEMQGLQVRNEAGSFCWAELNTRDPEGSKRFYGSVFGWGARTEESDSGSYTEWMQGENSIAGMWHMNGETPAEVPSHWRVFFTVRDVDATVARAQDLGATPLFPAMDIDIGRFAVLRDPTGAVFAVMSFNEG